MEQILSEPKILSEPRRPFGSYEYGEDIKAKAEEYREGIIARKFEPGEKLKGAFKKANEILGREINDWSDITAHELIVLLMNTRSKAIYAERDAVLNGSDWNIDEAQLLAGVAFNTFDTVAYNNGAWETDGAKDHSNPLPCNLLFISGALTKNAINGPQLACDKHVLNFDSEKVTINEKTLTKLYEQRLAPGLATQCERARIQKKKLVITIPGLGCGSFALETIQVSMIGALARALKQVFINHPEWGDVIDTVKLDTYTAEDGYVDFNGKTERGINLESIPKMRIEYDNSDQLRNQLEFPFSVSSRKGFNPQEFQLVHVVSWDPFSAPGNDMWAEQRQTDDGVSFASTDAFKALPDNKVDLSSAEYDANTKIFGTHKQRDDYTIEITSSMVFESKALQNKLIQQDAINTILNNYLEQRGTRQYHYAGLFSMFTLWSKPFANKNNAITTLTQALKGESVQFSPEDIAALRNGKLGRDLRTFIKSGNADCLFEGQQQIRTISQFIELLNEKTMSKPYSP